MGEAFLGFFPGLPEVDLAVHPTLAHHAALAFQDLRGGCVEVRCNFNDLTLVHQDVDHLAMPWAGRVQHPGLFQEKSLFHLRRSKVSKAKAMRAAAKKYHAKCLPEMCCSTKFRSWPSGWAQI